MIKKCVKKAVVVNDDAVQLRLISRILEKDGVEVSSCKSVQEAFAAMKDHTAPDIIVTDLHMPSIDGWRFCRLLRSPEYPEFNDVPILVVSATYSGEHAEEVNSTLGANGFLAAPFEAPVLLDNVRALLQGKTVLPLKKVLIVDDSLSVVNLIRNAFNAHGYTVFTALTGEEGLRLFHENQPDIAVLDYHLPDTTGDKLLKEIKQPGPLTVAVMITTDPTPELATRFIELGADGYARKPFDPEYLITLCENARRERALLRVEDILEDRTRQLRQSEERFRSLFKNIPEP
ncbi:MAG: response regulator, partial [Gemmatimonadota bacterium]|nr:response regulator [Gemmatimonadota bacterium]